MPFRGAWYQDAKEAGEAETEKEAQEPEETRETVGSTQPRSPVPVPGFGLWPPCRPFARSNRRGWLEFVD